MKLRARQEHPKTRFVSSASQQCWAQQSDCGPVQPIVKRVSTFLPTQQHLGETVTGDKIKWEKGLMHDPVEKYTPGRTHDGSIHVWVHPSVVGNNFGRKLFMDGSLMCKHAWIAGWTNWMGSSANP